MWGGSSGACSSRVLLCSGRTKVQQQFSLTDLHQLIQSNNITATPDAYRLVEVYYEHSTVHMGQVVILR